MHLLKVIREEKENVIFTLNLKAQYSQQLQTIEVHYFPHVLIKKVSWHCTYPEWPLEVAWAYCLTSPKDKWAEGCLPLNYTEGWRRCRCPWILGFDSVEQTGGLSWEEWVTQVHFSCEPMGQETTGEPQTMTVDHLGRQPHGRCQKDSQTSTPRAWRWHKACKWHAQGSNLHKESWLLVTF